MPPNYSVVIVSVIVAVLAVGAFVVDRAARAKRSPDADSGDFWAWVLLNYGAWVGLVAFVSTVLALSIRWWRLTRYHLNWDMVWTGWWPAIFSLAIPLFAWLAILAVAYSRHVLPFRARRDTANWIAGSAGFTNARYWVALFAPTLMIPLIWGAPRLGGEEGYPGAVWVFVASLCVTLFAVALSLGSGVLTSQPDRKPSAAPSPVALDPWPLAMQRQGVGLKRIAAWPKSPTLPAPSAVPLSIQLRTLNATTVSPQIINAVDSLVTPSSSRLREPQCRAIYAPDCAGQLEALTIGALNLANSLNLSTLVIAPTGSLNTLERDIRRCLPAPSPETPRQLPVHRISTDTDLTGLPGIWLTDAATLSDFFLPRLTRAEVAARIGLVVWWDLHEYSGVLAANLWAISRRFNRIISALGRSDLRTLIFVREARFGSAQMSSFVNRLLPYAIDPKHAVHVEQTLARPLEVHVLTGHAEFLHFAENQSRPESCLYPDLVGAMASINTGWKTVVTPDPNVPDNSLIDMENQRDRQGRSFGGQLEADRSNADATIQHVNEAGLLSLFEIASQAGRNKPGETPHWLGLTLPSNPYLGYLLQRMGSDVHFAGARRFVGAESQERIFKRQLLLALSERPDTYRGLQETLVREDDILRHTLDELAGLNQLGREEVRFLDARGDLIEEDLYTGRHERDRTWHPLTTISENLCKIQMKESDGEALLQVDEERLPIEAYTGRTFVSGGNRYSILRWDSPNPKAVTCRLEGNCVETWRVRTSQVFSIKRIGQETIVKSGAGLLKKVTAKLRYSESVTGCLTRQHDLVHGTYTDNDVFHIDPPHDTSFETIGLVLHWSTPPSPPVLLGLCQAFRHVLPAHLGTETDSIEVVPIEGAAIDGRGQHWGLVTVDLYPGGIGLVKAIQDDQQWLLNILGHIRDWLHYLTEEGSTSIVSPLARATGENESIGGTLDFLNSILGEPK